MRPDVTVRPDWTALIQTRRWVFALGIGSAYAISVSIGLAGWEQLSSIEHVLLMTSVPFFVAGMVLIRSGSYLWLFAPALGSLLMCAILVPLSHPQWIAAVLLTSYLAYTWVALTSRWVGLLGVVLGPVVLAAVWWQRPTNVIPGGLILADGSLALIQLAAATAMLWWAWNSLRVEADRSDAGLADLDSRTTQAMLVTARAAMWRLAQSRLHASVLNSIRYLLSSARVDREILRDFSIVSLPTPQDSALIDSVSPAVDSTTWDDPAPINKGRLLVTAALAGNALGGISYLIYLLADQGMRALPVVALGAVGSVSALVIVLRRKRVSAAFALPLIALPAILPWLFLSQDLGCQQALIVSPILNIAGFCVMVIAAWATRTTGVLGLLVWGLGTVLIALRVSTDCRQFMMVALINSLVTMPLIIIVTYAGTKAYATARRRAWEIRQQEIRERSRAAAALEVNSQLDGVVQEAVALMGAIAEGADVDEQMAERLRLVDGRIRANMQVGPQGSGAFALLAKSIVDHMASRGRAVMVKAINSSPDLRPLPQSALEVVEQLIYGSQGRVSVQVITDGHEDFLSVTVSASALIPAGLKAGTSTSWNDCMLDIEVTDEDGGGSGTATVVLSRAIAESD
jgi:hypothetical protein